MRLNELVFREVNVVLVHGGIPVQNVSLDRVRSARAAMNMQVTSGPGTLQVLYPDERLVAVFDQNRVTVTDTSTRHPELTPIIDVVMAQHQAIGAPPVLAYGYNVRLDFEVEGLEQPAAVLTGGLLRDPGAVADVLRASEFQAGLNLLYRRGVKLWTLRLDPILGLPRRLACHANIHEDLAPAPPPDPGGSGGPPAPPWLEAGLGVPGNPLPSIETLKADLSVQVRAALDTAVGLLVLGRR